MNYLQKKKQAIIMMLAAQIIKTAEGYPLTVNDCENGAAVDYTVYGNAGAIGKNLIPYPYYDKTKTINGVTFTDNGDGTITVNGTATADTYFILQSYAPLNGTYTLSGCQNGSKTTYILGLGSSDNADVGNGVTATINRKVNIFIKVSSGAILDNVVFKPQLELGTTATEYEPYKEGYVGDKTDNLIDEDTVLTEQGWVKQADGSYYVENNRDVYRKKIWENTEGYTGRLRVSYRFKYKQSKAEAGGAGSYLQIVYTDGTTFNVWLPASKWDADTWLLPNADYTLTNASKTVDYIWWIYGTGMNSTWVKNIFVSKNTAVTQYEPCGYKIPIVNSGKNLIPYPYTETTKTQNGITFTDNGDGSITVNGTATAHTYFILSGDLIFKSDNPMMLSGCPNGGSTSTFCVTTYGKGADYRDVGNGIILDNNMTKNIRILIFSGTTVDNITFKPMLELGKIATEYEPYRAPSTANIYLHEPLKQGESVNFGLDNLPELQLFEGSNTITANTAVKPEKISVDYYEKG